MKKLILSSLIAVVLLIIGCKTVTFVSTAPPPTYSNVPPPPPPPDRGGFYAALNNLRAARWMIDHKTGDWQSSDDEIASVRKIDDAINELRRAGIDDGRNVYDHPPLQEIYERRARLAQGMQYLQNARADIQAADDRGIEGIKQRDFVHIEEAIQFTQRAASVMMDYGNRMPPPQQAPDRSGFLTALSDLRAARWMIDHKPGNWQATDDEAASVRKIDDAINELRRAGIDDGGNMYDHPPVQEINEHRGRLGKGLEYLQQARANIQGADDRGVEGLKQRAFVHIDEAIQLAQRTWSVPVNEQMRMDQQTPPPVNEQMQMTQQTPPPPPANQQMRMDQRPPAFDRSGFLTALSDLRAARWMIDHKPGNWQASDDEAASVRKIDDAINELQRAAIYDGKNIYDHPQVQEINEHRGRLGKGIEYLQKARVDIEMADERGVEGLKQRAFVHIDEAIQLAQRAWSVPVSEPVRTDQQTPPPVNEQMRMDQRTPPPAEQMRVAQQTPPPPPANQQMRMDQRPPAFDRSGFLTALSDLRAARWMIDHKPGNWQATDDETAAVRKIDDAINELKRAAIDDGKNVNDHPPVQEINEHRGRLGKGLEYLQKARADIQGADERGVEGLKQRAFAHIDEAIRLTQKASRN